MTSARELGDRLGYLGSGDIDVNAVFAALSAHARRVQLAGAQA